MMTKGGIDYASTVDIGQMVFDDNPTANYASWKRDVEYIIDRQLEPTEATTIYDLASNRRAHLAIRVDVD